MNTCLTARCEREQKRLISSLGGDRAQGQFSGGKDERA